MKTTISVITATFNRAYILPVLYESLRRQTLQTFEWIIVDDGSTDNTRELVAEWVENSDFIVKYFYQKNAGVSIAYDRAIAASEMDLVALVDSDDFLVDNALQRILDYWNEFGGEKYFGILSPRFRISTGDYAINAFPKGVVSATAEDLYGKYHYKGETFPVYVTELAKKITYPNIEGQRLNGEGYRFHVSQVMGYAFCLLPEKLCAYDYLPDGLTKAHITKKKIHSNIDALIIGSKVKTHRAFRVYTRYTSMARLQYYSMIKHGVIRGFLTADNRGLAVLAAPLTLAVAIKHRIRRK